MNPKSRKNVEMSPLHVDETHRGLWLDPFCRTGLHILLTSLAISVHFGKMPDLDQGRQMP
jgi:hypothetical protein